MKMTRRKHSLLDAILTLLATLVDRKTWRGSIAERHHFTDLARGDDRHQTGVAMPVTHDNEMVLLQPGCHADNRDRS
jgi:hypothetical protein